MSGWFTCISSHQQFVGPAEDREVGHSPPAGLAWNVRASCWLPAICPTPASSEATLVERDLHGQAWTEFETLGLMSCPAV